MQLKFWADEAGRKASTAAVNAALMSCEDSLYSRMIVEFFEQNTRITSDDTIEEYQVSIRSYCVWWHAQRGSWPREEDVTAGTIGHFANHVVDAGRSAPTANKHIGNLKALVRFLSKRRLDVPKIPALKKEVRTWHDHHVQKILDQCCLEQGYLGPYLASDFWTGLHLAFLATGGRLTAVMAVGREDVDLDRFLIKLSAEDQKHKSDETKQFMPEAAVVFRRLLASHSGGLFDGFPFSQQHLQKLYADVLSRAGLPSGSKDKFHNLRRYVATKKYIATGSIYEVQRFLGHSDPQVTWKYIDLTQVPDRVQTACDALPRFTLGDGPRIFRAS